MAPPSPLQLPALDLEERDLEDFGDREEDTVAMALEIAADEHLTFMPQTTESVFTQALDPLPTAETYLDGYQALNARSGWLRGFRKTSSCPPRIGFLHHCPP